MPQKYLMLLLEKQISLRAAVLGVTTIIGIQILVLYLFGQPPICECGYIKIWEGVVTSSGNSQHLTDWYTPSHVIHGFLFYLLLWWIFPKMSILVRFLLALGIEVGWEILENTPIVIEHYRKQALAAGYTGDSIINSVFDSLWMAAGFLVARTIPVWAVGVILVTFELGTLYLIRDNLTLNIINLIYPLEFISTWQVAL